eukprot:GHVQ01023789.1.p1 GENE.GHVQ01023789.1~~GHVQ01023789.1.p1  ORF type:complete len:205 (+),score=6.57 GHVQ01023789.1:380-994(+)
MRPTRRIMATPWFIRSLKHTPSSNFNGAMCIQKYPSSSTGNYGVSPSMRPYTKRRRLCLTQHHVSNTCSGIIRDGNLLKISLSVADQVTSGTEDVKMPTNLNRETHPHRCVSGIVFTRISGPVSVEALLRSSIGGHVRIHHCGCGELAEMSGSLCAPLFYAVVCILSAYGICKFQDFNLFAHLSKHVVKMVSWSTANGSAFDGE